MSALNFIRKIVRTIAIACMRAIRLPAPGIAAVALGLALTAEIAPKVTAVVMAVTAIIAADFAVAPEAKAGSQVQRVQRAIRAWENAGKNLPDHRHGIKSADTWMRDAPSNFWHENWRGIKRESLGHFRRKISEVLDCLAEDDPEDVDPRCARLLAAIETRLAAIEKRKIKQCLEEWDDFHDEVDIVIMSGFLGMQRQQKSLVNFGPLIPRRRFFCVFPGPAGGPMGGEDGDSAADQQLEK